MTANLGGDLKKLLLAGIGAAALTSEKTKELIEELVKKGELTVEQGKVLNEELKHNVKQKIRENVTINVASPQSVDELEQAIGKLSPEELSALKGRIAKLDADRQAESARQDDADI